MCMCDMCDFSKSPFVTKAATCAAMALALFGSLLVSRRILASQKDTSLPLQKKRKRIFLIAANPAISTPQNEGNDHPVPIETPSSPLSSSCSSLEEVTYTCMNLIQDTDMDPNKNFETQQRLVLEKSIDWEARLRQAGNYIRRCIAYEPFLVFIPQHVKLQMTQSYRDAVYEVLIGGGFCPRLMALVEEPLLGLPELESVKFGSSKPNQQQHVPFFAFDRAYDRASFFVYTILTYFFSSSCPYLSLLTHRACPSHEQVANIVVLVHPVMCARLLARLLRWDPQRAQIYGSELATGMMNNKTRMYVLEAGGLMDYNDNNNDNNSDDMGFQLVEVVTSEQDRNKGAVAQVHTSLRQCSSPQDPFVGPNNEPRLPWYSRTDRYE